MAENIDTVIVDSSFLLSTMLPDEEVSPPFWEYIKKFRQNKIIFKSCELLKYEICNSLKSAIGQKRISSKRANIIYSAFELMEIEYSDIDFRKTMDLSIKKWFIFLRRFISVLGQGQQIQASDLG